MRDTDEAITVKQACRILGGDEAPIAPSFGPTCSRMMVVRYVSAWPNYCPSQLSKRSSRWPDNGKAGGPRAPADLSDRGRTACFAANSFLATCAAVHESRHGYNSDGSPDGSSTTDADGSNGHRLLERRNWSDCPLERTPPRHRQDQPLRQLRGWLRSLR